MKKAVFCFLLLVVSYSALSFVNQFQKPFCIAKKVRFADSKTLHDLPYYICSTPGGRYDSLIVNIINHAKSYVLVESYNFSSVPVMNALIRAKKRGVRVEILLDKADLKPRYKIIEMLKRFNIPFKIDTKPAVTHNKLMIVDDEIVIAGSYNFTKSPELRNAENLLVIKDKASAGKYFLRYEHKKMKSVIY